MTCGASRWGAAAAAWANFAENSPKLRCWLRRRMRPKVAASQKAVRATVAEHHLVAGREAPQFGQAGTQPAHERLDRRLPVTGAEHGGGRRLQGRHRLGPHLRGAAAEAAVSGQQVSRDFDIGRSQLGHCETMAAMARISQRIAAVAESATLAIDAKAKALAAAGEDVIGFGAGEPDFPTPAHIVAAAQDACSDPRNHKYTPAGGLPELREAVAAKTARDSGYAVAAAQVLITNGGKQAVDETFATLLDPGDEVLLPAPYWTTYPEAIRLAGGVPVEVQTTLGGRLSGHDRAARGGPHAADQGAAVRVTVQPHRGGVPAGRGRGHRSLGRRGRYLGHHRRDLRASGVCGGPASRRCPSWCRSWRTPAWSSTASPRPMP